MRRAEASQSITKRMQTATSPQGSSEFPPKIMENISFLNRSCKFLSYVEKEKLISLIKSQDPEIESLLFSLRESNASKEELKSTFYSVLYPKQNSKRATENMNFSQRPQQSTNKRLAQPESKPKKAVPVAAVKLELGIGEPAQSLRASKASIRTPTSRTSDIDQTPPYGRAGSSQGSRNQLSQGNIRSGQRLQGGFSEAATRGKSVERGVNVKNSYNKEVSGGLRTTGNKVRSPQYGARAQDLPKVESFFTHKGGDKQNMYVLSEHTESVGESNPPSAAFEGTSPDFLVSLGLKPTKDAPSPRGSSSQGGSTPSGALGARISKQVKEQTFGMQQDLRSKMDINKKSETFRETNEERYHEISRNQNGNGWENYKAQAASSSALQAGLPRKSTEKGYKEDKGRVEKTTEKDRGEYRLSGVSERTKEVLHSLLGDLGDGELYQNLMKKLGESALHTDPEHEPQTEKREINLVPEHGWENGKSVIELKNSNIGFSYEPGTGKSTDSRKEGLGFASYLDEKNKTETKKMGGSIIQGEYSTKTRTEKYVSVNMIKRLLDSRMIYTEDIVDEVFRYLGENIVNKNYFAQIMSNYLNSLSEQPTLSTQDIVNKMFEICDRNGDGLISPNDLGSGATLFSQYRPTVSKERKLYRLLDPQSRGFVIETDIISVLTKTNTLANSVGSKLYEGPEEIGEFARKLMKELDKEKKGVITYWDMFLWKDTHSFSDLVTQLERYTNKLDILSSTKKSMISTASPAHDKHDLMSDFGKRSPNLAHSDFPRLHSTLSPDAYMNQGSASARLNIYGSEQPKTASIGPYTDFMGSSLTGAALTAPTTNNVYINPPYTSTYQSPPNALVQNLSAFESLSKDIKGEALLQSVGSAGLDMKGYATDLTLTPQSKFHTPGEDPLKSNLGSYVSPMPQEKPLSQNISTHEEFKVNPSIYDGKSTQETTTLGNVGVGASDVGNVVTAGNYIYTTDSRMRELTSPQYEPSYTYSSDTKAYMQSPSADIKDYMDLPYKSNAFDTKISLLNSQEKDNLVKLVESKEFLGSSGMRDYSYNITYGDVKSYSAGVDLIGNLGLKETKDYTADMKNSKAKLADDYLAQGINMQAYSNNMPPLHSSHTFQTPTYDLGSAQNLSDQNKEENKYQIKTSQDYVDSTLNQNLKESRYTTDPQGYLQSVQMNVNTQDLNSGYKADYIKYEETYSPGVENLNYKISDDVDIIAGKFSSSPGPRSYSPSSNKYKNEIIDWRSNSEEKKNERKAEPENFATYLGRFSKEDIENSPEKSTEEINFENNYEHEENNY